MTAPDNTLAGEVVQADRDAAASAAVGGQTTHRSAILSGKFDGSEAVKAFARHRIEATRQADERVKELEGALADILPPTLCGESWSLPDDEAVSITVTFGKLKRARATLGKDAPK